MQPAKLLLSYLICCAVSLASSVSANKCWQAPDTHCNEDFQLSGWFPQPAIRNRIIRQCVKMQTCSNSTYFSSKEECEEKCVLKCQEPTPSPPYEPNTLVITKELQGGSGVTYSSISTCGRGFIMIGSAERKCNAAGNWTGVEPICYEIIISVSVRKDDKDERQYELDSKNILQVEEGQQLLISCTVKETDSVDHMVWRKVKGQTTHALPPMHDMREGMDIMSSYIYIQIDHARFVHSGTYSCMSDSITRLSRNFTIQVKDPKKAPKIVSASVKVDHNSIQLMCHARGKPAPEVNWFEDDVLVSGETNIISANEDKLLEISIQDPNCTHIGKYVCKATNKHGTTNYTAKSVTAQDLGLPDMGSTDECGESCLLCPQPKSIAPVVKTCSMSDTVIIAQLIVNETSLENNTFVINSSHIIKGSNSSHLNTLKLTEEASACGCLTLESQSWYICTGTRKEDMLIVSENDIVYAASDHYRRKVEKHCRLMEQ